jgi:hypothetical protein
MSRTSQPVSDHSHRRGAQSKRRPLALIELGKRFERFRAEHPRGTRVPEDLREAALASLRGGIAPGELYRACGVTWSQVMAWKGARPSAPATRRRAEPTDVRVFSVVDEKPLERPECTAPVVGDELELCLGPWSVRVRLTAAEPAVRGESCCR